MKRVEVQLITSRGERIELNEDAYRIGSFDGVCHYVINESNVSPIHAVIEWNDSEWVVKDLNSAGGVVLNGQRIGANEEQSLKQRDTIQVGTVIFTVIMDLEMFKTPDITLMNDFYGRWLLETDGNVRKVYRDELVKLMLDKLKLIDYDLSVGGVSEIKKEAAAPDPFRSDFLSEKPESETLPESPSAGEMQTGELDNGEETEILSTPAYEPQPVYMDPEPIRVSVNDHEPVEMATTILDSGVEDDMVTTVLNALDTSTDATTVLSVEGDSGATTVLNDDFGIAPTVVLAQEGTEATTVLGMDDDEGATTILGGDYSRNSQQDAEEEAATVLLSNDEDDYGATEVISDVSFCILERVNNSNIKIRVDCNPFIIGKQMHQVNYCLDERGISRRHSKIMRSEDGGYLIGDLESKNGTYINGRRIEKNQMVEMKNGDMISFAEYNFIVTIG